MTQKAERETRDHCWTWTASLTVYGLREQDRLNLYWLRGSVQIRRTTTTHGVFNFLSLFLCSSEQGGCFLLPVQSLCGGISGVEDDQEHVPHFAGRGTH